jgi:response regulator RpfG family c-di-GMP phosphodiesterase
MPTPPRVLIADDDVSDLLVLRRLLRDTPYTVDTVRSASQAIVALGQREYAAVVADDERLPDMSGASLLLEAERTQKAALRILLSRPERKEALLPAAEEAHYQLIVRPFFAQPLTASLVEHAARWLLPEAKREDTQRTVNPLIDVSESPEPAKAHVPAPGRMTQRRILLTMVELVEAKAGHASGHGARVGALAGVLARELGVSDADLEVIEDAALVHDVGELALDANLLREPRRFSLEEEREVRRHVASSHQIARRAGLADPVLAAIRHHHERWDGRGHPDALLGEAIPLAARVLAVADVWDALATDRPYRPAVPLPGCVDTFRALSGAELDPHLVSVYLDKQLYELIDWSDPPRPGVKLL